MRSGKCAVVLGLDACVDALTSDGENGGQVEAEEVISVTCS